MRKITFLLVLGLLSFTKAFSVAPYYVSTTGNDSNTGLGRTDAEAWRTLQHAADTVVAADNVIVLPGTYDGVKANGNDGNASAWITFKAETNGTVFLRRNTTAGADHDVLPIGTVWTNMGGNKWRSPTNSVLSNGTGLLKNHDYWFAKTSFSANVTGHGNDPWFWYDSTNKRVEINSTTDPSLDEFIAVDGNSIPLHVTGVSYYSFEGFVLEYGAQGILLGNGNNVGDEVSHIKIKNCTSRYNGIRGSLALGEPNAMSSYIDFFNYTAYRNFEHGFKVGSNSSQTIGLVSHVTCTGCVSFENGYNGFQVSSSGNFVNIYDSIAYDNGSNPCGTTSFSGEGCASFTANFSNGVADNVTWVNLTSYSTGTRPYFGTDNTALLNSRHGISMFATNNMVINRVNSYGNKGCGFFATTANATSYVNNVVKNSVFRGNQQWDVCFNGTDNISFYNNTLDGATLGEVNFKETSTGINFKNNAVIASTGVPLVKIASPILDGGVVTVPNASSANAIYSSTAFSVEFKGTLTDSVATTSYIIDKRNSGATTGYVFYVKTDRTVGVQIFTGGTAKTTETTTTISYGSPVHLVFTWANAAAPKIYIDGTEASYSFNHASATTPGDDTANQVNIGNGLTKSNLWLGPMTKLQIYRGKTLTSGEVTTLYGGGSVSGATATYLFTEGSGTTLGDTSGNSNNGTINAYASWSGSSLVFRQSHDVYSGVMDYNAYYSPDSTPFQYNETAYNFSGFKSASSQDSHGINSDFRADFTSYSSHNYSLTSSSNTLRDAGTDLSASSVTSDFRVLPRPQGSAYSIGAYEEGSGILIQ